MTHRRGVGRKLNQSLERRSRLHVGGRLVVLQRPRTSWPTIIVWLLFLASVGTLLFNSFVAFLLPRQEQSIRDQLRAATSKLVQSAEPDVDQFLTSAKPLSHEANLGLETLTDT